MSEMPGNAPDLRGIICWSKRPGEYQLLFGSFGGGYETVEGTVADAARLADSLGWGLVATPDWVTIWSADPADFRFSSAQMTVQLTDEDPQ